MSEFENNIKVEIGSEKNFGIVFGCVATIIGCYPLIYGEGVRLWALIAAGLFFFFALFLPSLLKVPNKLWYKFGMLLGAIIAPLAMAVVYFLTIMPIGLLLRLTGRDLLLKKLDSKEKSYWIKRTESIGSMRKQF